MPRETKMAATRTSLIEAALEEFARTGLDASLDAICARADLTRGAFYVHFADRDALIRAVGMHVLGDLVAGLTAFQPNSGATERAIRLFVAAAHARAPAVHGGRNLRFHHLLDACRRSRTLGDDYRRFLIDARDRMAGGIARDAEQDRIRATPPPDALADVLVVAALGMVAALELDLPLDLARLGETLLALLADPAPV